MDINQTRQCNQWNLRRLAQYLGEEPDCFERYYHELLEDQKLLTAINKRISLVRNEFHYDKGIFRQNELTTVDWFAFERILLYVLVRHFQPEQCLETGVFYGGNSLFLLAAIYRNGKGTLTSIDLEPCFPEMTMAASK